MQYLIEENPPARSQVSWKICMVFIVSKTPWRSESNIPVILDNPGTSVPNEKEFSCTCDIVTAVWSRLDHELVEQLIF